MTTLRNRYTIASAALVLGAALLASAGTAQARGGGGMGGTHVATVSMVSSHTTIVRDHRGNRNGEGGVTITSGSPRHCGADVCVTGSNYSGFYGRVYDHRSH